TLVFLCAVAAIVLGLDVKRFLDTPLARADDTIVNIAPGMGFAAITDLLQAQGIIGKPRDALYFSLYARYTGMATQIKSGRYRVPAAIHPAALLTLLTSGKTVRYRITIIDGWTFADMRAAVAATDELEHTLAGKTAADIMAALGHA